MRSNGYLSFPLAQKAPVRSPLSHGRGVIRCCGHFAGGGVKRVTQVLRDEGRQSEALIQLADENQPSVRRDLIP